MEKKVSKLKGKTFEEIFGEKKAREIKKRLSDAHKGRTYIDIFGEEKAKLIIKKQNLTKKSKGFIPFLNCKKNYKHSEETKRKIGLGNKGKVRTEEEKLNNRLKHLGKIPWNKGLTKDKDERVQKYANSLTGRKMPREVVEKATKNHKYYTGKEHPMFGKKHTKETREHLSKVHTGVKLSEYHRSRQRIGTIEYIKKYCDGVCPMRGKYENKIIDSLEEIFQTKIIREFYVDGYYLDGYIPEIRLAIEVDENHHFDEKGNLIEKDIERQKRIEELLKCTFLRIKVKDYLKKLKV